MGYHLKAPAAAVDYAVDWGAGYLGVRTLSASDWTVEPEEPGGVVVAAELMGERRTAATLEGGRPGRVYRITNRVMLSDGRCDARSLAIRVEDR